MTGGSFGQLFSTAISGQVYAQPLVSQGILFIATENDTVYGLDAVTGAQIWTRTVGSPVPATVIGCTNIQPNYGITGTPVMDTSANPARAYFLAKEFMTGTSGTVVYRAHGVSIADGSELAGFPVVIQGTATNDSTHTFDGLHELQRPGLLLMNGVVYAGFGSHCDNPPYAGWIVGISTTGQITTLWTTEASPGACGASVWAPGALASDGAGQIVFATGNSAAIDVANGCSASDSTASAAGSPPPPTLPESAVRVVVQSDGSLTATDFFSPSNATALDVADLDYGSSSPLLLPSTPFGTASFPNLMVTGSKEGYLYLLNRDSFGGRGQGAGGGDAVLWRSATGAVNGSWAKPSVWPGDGGYVYLLDAVESATSGRIRAFSYGVDGSGNPILTQAGISNGTAGYGYVTGSPMVTSNGTTSGSALVWATWAMTSSKTAELRAYDAIPDASNVLNERWHAAIGTMSTFSSPGIAGGRVYVGTGDGHVLGFGISSNTAPTIASPAAANPNPVSGTTAALSVLGADDGGESNLVYTWATTGTPPAAVTFTANASNAAKSTTATFTKAGAYVLQITIADRGNLSVVSSVAVTVNQSLTSIVVAPATAAVVVSATQQFTATARDQFGVNLTTQPTFTWTVGGGGAIDASGLFTAGANAGGPFTVLAQSGGVSGTGSVSVVSTAPIAVYQIDCGSTTAVSPFKADQFGSGGTMRTVTNTINLTGATNPAPQAVYQSERYGTSTYTFPNLTATSSYTVRLHFAELFQTATGKRIFNVLINGATVLSNFDIFATTGARFKAITRDFAANANASGQIVINFNTITDNATIEGIEILQTTPNAPPTIVTAASANPNPVSGTATALSVLGADDGGEANLTYTWTTAGTPPAAVAFSANGTNAAKSTTATFSSAGSYAVQVTVQDQGGQTATSSVSVVVTQTLTSIALTPTNVTIAPSTTQQFTASARDQFATVLAIPPDFTWTVSGLGTIDANGLYTAPSTAGGPYTVSARSGSVAGTASITVASPNAAPTIATPATATPNPTSGSATQLSVLGADDNGEANLTYTWATIGAPPAAVVFSPNGTNAAKASTATFSKAGSYSLQTTVRDQGNLTATSTLSVTVNQTLASIVVSPASATVAASATQQFTASALDQFATALATQPSFTWSVSGGGTINSSGLFAAGPTGGGPFTVSALSGSISGTGSVTVSSTPTTVYRIDCGGKAVSPFTADQFFSGGTARTVTNSITISGLTNPAPQGVYQSERYGNVTYTLPNLVASAQYTVRLHFAELFQTAAGKRLFNVAINGTTVLSNFDIFATTGGRFRATLREFTTTASSSGQIVIVFTTIVNNATIEGIEIIGP